MNDYYQDYKDFFSGRILKLRAARGVSAREMSFAIGQGKGYIGQLERKNSLPSMTAFLGMCDYLKITPKDFFDDEVEFPAVYGELLENLKGLDDEQLTSINNIAKGLKKGK